MLVGLWGRSAGIARRSGAGAAWAAVRITFACALGWSGGRRQAAGDHAASPRGPPPAGRPRIRWQVRGVVPRSRSGAAGMAIPRRVTRLQSAGHRGTLLRPAVRRGSPAIGPDEGRGAGLRGSSAGGGSTRRGRPGGHVRGGARVGRGEAPVQRRMIAGGGGIRPRRAPPRGGCLFGRARDTWSAEWFVGCLWKRGGWRGGQQNTTISWWRTGQCYKSTECI